MSTKVFDLNVFNSSFKSLDLRTAAVKTDGGWTNLISSLFFSNKSVDDVRVEQQKISTRLGLSSDGDFGFFFGCYSIDNLSNLFQQINKGEVIVGRRSIKFRPFNPYELRVDCFLPNYLKEIDEWRLCGAEGKGSEEERKNFWPLVDAQDGKTRLIGYDSVYELISDIVRLRDFNSGRERDFVIGIPVYARIVELTSKRLKILRHLRLDNLQCNISLARRDRQMNYQPIQRQQFVVPECKTPFKEEFCSLEIPIQSKDMKPHDRIEAELINKKVPTLELDRSHTYVPLENVVEPFAKTLFSFCTFEEYKKRLLNPETSKEADKVFQDAVLWLLSLAGFSVIPLGKTKFEILKTETGYELGSIDLLAYRENEHLLLVECDTSVPDEKKVRSLLQLKKYFKFIQDGHGEPLITAVIFSPRDCRDVSHPLHELNIIDQQQITLLLENAMKGNTESMRTSLIY